MNFKSIDKWSYRYAFLRVIVNFAHNIIFYRKVCVTGKENIPADSPLFFAPNHQNALMDALAIICNIKKQPVFIARADIFKNPIIARILILLKILPAYRIRDGKENLAKNEEIFNVSVKILENKSILTLFPETTHTDLRQLRILKKGVQRIVFQAEEKNNYQLGIKVVPIGIYYSNYWNFRSDIQINFGKPIELSEYNEIYKTNPQKAMLALRDKISDEIKPLIIHIPGSEFYALFDFMREFYNHRMRLKLSLKNNQNNRFIADQNIIASMDKFSSNASEKIREFDILARAYKRMLQKLKIRNWVIDKNQNLILLMLKSIGLLACLPLLIYGWFNHFFPYYIPLPLTKKLKDKQFISSINFVAGLVLFPLFYLIQFILVWAFTDVWWIKFLYLIIMLLKALTNFFGQS